ncbi:MAG TPA: hypothetical protein VFZ85_11855 [Jiangellaceae bacterium]
MTTTTQTMSNSQSTSPGDPPDFRAILRAVHLEVALAHLARQAEVGSRP